MTGAQALTAALALSLSTRGDVPLNKAQVDFLGCMISAIMEAVPCFLTSFMGCLAGGDTTGYEPGARIRCS